MDFEKLVLAKLDKIEDKQEQHTVELARNTIILTQHHVRSSNLESRFKPIEYHVLFINKLSKVSLAVLGALAAIASILKLLK